MTRNLLLALAVVGLVGLSAAPLAAAQDEMVTVTAREGEACGEDTFCFETSTDSFEAGTVEFTLENPDVNTVHNLCIAVAGTNHCTPGETEYAEGGTTNTMEVTFDEGGSYTYWCNVPGHRGLGMEGTFTVTGGTGNGDGDGGAGNGGAGDGGAGNGGGGAGNGGDRGSPGIGLLSIVAGVALLAIALRRR